MERVGRVVVVGLGPAGVDLLTPRTQAAIQGSERRFARTGRHPAVEELARDGITFHTFDALYDATAELDAVYSAIVDELVQAANAAGAGDVVYAVPGNPAVAEQTVGLLQEAARAGRVRVDVEDTPQNLQAMRDLKETLKTRFEQLDIWITAHRIEIV